MVAIDNIPHLSIKALTPFGFSDEFLRTRTKENRQGLTTHYAHIKGVDPDGTSSKPVTLISYDSIPEQTRIEKGMPSKEDLLKQCQQKDLFRLTGLNQEAYQLFLANPDIKDTKEATRDHIAKGKAEQVHILKAIAALKPKDVTMRGHKDKDEFFQFCIDQLNKIAEERRWYKWKCSTINELQKRVTLFNKVLKGKTSLADACKEMVSKKAGNVNAEKIGLDQKALLVQLMADANAKPNFEQVHQIYMRKAVEMVSLEHWSPDTLISASTVRAFLTKPEIMQLWYEARHGYQEYRNIYEPVTQRERPSYANALWVIDGTPSHRYFQHGEKGRYYRFNIFPVLDAHSYCVIGFWLSDKENTEAVLGALRSACYVSGCLPHQILYDNSSAIQSYRAQESINKISVVSFAATAGNARSKIIENFFHLFNQDVQKYRPGYTANPFAARLDNQPNREALALLVKNHELPLAEQALTQAIEDLTIWNNSPRKFLGGLTPLETYKRSVEATKAKQRKFSQVLDVEAFWTLPGENKKVRSIEEGKPKMVNTFIPQQYQFTNRGIDIVINGKSLTYDIEDPQFRRLYIGQRFTVKYEPNSKFWTNGQQPDSLLLYLQGAPLQWNGVHASALPKELMPMAISDYRPGTRAQLDNRIANKKTQRSFVQQDFKDLVEHTKTNGTYTEVITANAFDKEVLEGAREMRLNSVIDGTDNWNNVAPSAAPVKAKATKKKLEGEDLPPLNRLGDEYDTPIPLQD